MEYNKEIKSIDEKIFSDMRICSYNLSCDAYMIDFQQKGKYELYRLYRESDRLSSYFSIPGSQSNVLEIYLPKQNYKKMIENVRISVLLELLIVTLVLILLSSLFAIYTLSPLRKALHLTEEFIKDILHDFNTPLSTLRLNIAMLKEQVGGNAKIRRVEKSVDNILSLQANLRAYLEEHVAQKEQFELKKVIVERVDFIHAGYRDITFTIDLAAQQIMTNREAFIRIVDNIIGNAAKYNKEEGSIEILYSDGILSISDTGKGIKNPKRVFERFYKEQDRGIGIGLHIVKKLCEELDIKISLESEPSKGTTFYLDLTSIIV